MGFDGCRALDPLDNPLQHAHVLAEARPEELAVVVLAEPVDAENARRVPRRWRPIFSQWRSSRPCGSRRTAASRRDRGARRRLADRRRGRLGTHGGGQIDAVVPVEAWKTSGMRLARRPPKMKALDRHAGRVLPVRIDAGHWPAGAVKRALGCAAGRPQPGVQSSPCQSVRCAGGSSVIPSHHTSPSAVSATLVKMVFSRSSSWRWDWTCSWCRARRRRSRLPG